MTCYNLVLKFYLSNQPLYPSFREKCHILDLMLIGGKGAGEATKYCLYNTQIGNCLP